MDHQMLQHRSRPGVVPRLDDPIRGPAGVQAAYCGVSRLIGAEYRTGWSVSCTGVTGGNPFYVREVARLLVAQGAAHDACHNASQWKGRVL